MIERPSSHDSARHVLIAVTGILSTILWGCDSAPRSTIYSADPITAWVVDEETGKPIEGANVLAMWELKYGLENHGTNYAMVMEAVTDAEGKFSLPGWGPKVVTLRGAITTAQPRFLIFRAGYELGMGANSAHYELAPSHMTSVWNGKRFQVRKFAGPKAEYARYLNLYLMGDLESLFRNGCHGLSLSRFLEAVDTQSRELVNPIAGQRTTLEALNGSFGERCGVILPEGRR